MNIAVTSNIANRIQKIRRGAVYSEWTCFVAELIQNAQRAKAKNIQIETYSGYFRIFDDGVGCKNPEEVFTLDFSGWGEDVHSPFGEGFSSTFAIADEIIVRSETWEARLNVKKSIEENDFNSVEITPVAQTMGFEVIMYFSDSYNTDKIITEVKKIGAMIKADITLNNQLITKKTISYEPFTVRRSLRDFGEAIVAPSEDYAPIEVIYEGRPVTTLYIDGLKGLLALRPGAVTLRAPDRREIVFDDKRTRLNQRLRDLSEEILRILVSDYSDQIPDFKNSIKNLLPPSQYARKISYGLLPTKKEKQEVRKEEYRVADIGQELFKPKELEAENRGLVTREYDETSSNVCEDSQEEITEIRKLVRQSKVFYRLYHEEDLSDIQAEVEYYGMTVLVVDELAAEALKWMNVPHLEDANYEVYQNFTYSKVGPRTKKEERILKLLEPIARHYGISPRVFDFADIKCVVETQIGDRVVNRDNFPVYGVCDKSGSLGKILLSRKELRIRQLDVTYGAQLGTTKDLKILMNIVPTVAHEMCHLLYDSKDNTLEMAKKEKQMAREIFGLITRIY